MGFLSRSQYRSLDSMRESRPPVSRPATVPRFFQADGTSSPAQVESRFDEFDRIRKVAANMAAKRV